MLGLCRRQLFNGRHRLSHAEPARWAFDEDAYRSTGRVELLIEAARRVTIGGRNLDALALGVKYAATVEACQLAVSAVIGARLNISGCCAGRLSGSNTIRARRSMPFTVAARQGIRRRLGLRLEDGLFGLFGEFERRGLRARLILELLSC